MFMQMYVVNYFFYYIFNAHTPVFNLHFFIR